MRFRNVMLGLAAACVACCALPLLGGLGLGAGISALAAFRLEWTEVLLLVVGLLVAGLFVMKLRMFAPARAATAGCGDGCLPPQTPPRKRVEEKAPIACTLTGDDFQARTRWIRQMASDHLVSAERSPLSLRLVYAPAAASLVTDLVQKESACCAFLQFDVAVTGTGVQLIITAPEDARYAADALFDHFSPDPVNSPKPLEMVK